jgi:hypothetical protein
LKLQNILKNEVNNIIDENGKSLEKYLYFQEKGNMKMKLNIDSKEI